MNKILIVDDDPNLGLLYEQEFTEDGFRTTLVDNGLDALEAVKRDRPDLAIIDIAMPGMDGIELLTRILHIDKTIPIVLNTAYSNYKDNFMTWSADAYVTKSGDISTLKETVNKLLAKASNAKKTMEASAESEVGHEP